MAGDFNAKAVEWGMPHPDSRGSYLLDMAATFRRPGYMETIPDVSFASETLNPRVTGWEVLEDYTASDHQYIGFEVQDRCQEYHVKNTIRRWNLNKMNRHIFDDILTNGL